MTIRYIEPFQRGWERMTHILFETFDVGKWLLLAFTLWLARLGSGGGTGFHWKASSDEVSTPREAMNGMCEAWEGLLDHALWIPLIVLLLVVIVAIILVLLWLSSRGRFIFLDNVVHNRATIVEPWCRLGKLGNSLFLWRLGFAIACLVVSGLVVLLVLAPVLAASTHDVWKGVSIAAVLFAIVAMLVIGLVAAVISLFVDSFIVPIMYRFNLGVLAAWGHFLPWLSTHPLHFALYALFVLLLLIVLGVLFLAVCIFACLTCCLALVLILPLIGSYVYAVIFLPLYVTYRAFTVEFLAQFDSAFDLFREAAEVEAGS
jgi:hypothetical protein